VLLESQVALPLPHLTAGRVTSLYDLMDSAYDVAEIRARSRKFGHVPVIAPNPRTRAREQALEAEAPARRAAGHLPAEQRRLRERSKSSGSTGASKTSSAVAGSRSAAT
jgi:hypothetical protein